MNVFRLSIRSRCPGHNPSFADLAVSKPPGHYEQLLINHSLVPFNGGVAAIGDFKTPRAAKQAHDDLVLLIHAIESTGLGIAEDQSVIYRDRRVSALFTKPVVLEDERGEIVVLDLRKGPEPGSSVSNWITSDPLKALGWNVAGVEVPELASGCHYRLSSPTVDVGPIQERTFKFTE